MWNLDNSADEVIYRTETDAQTWKLNLRLPKEKLGNGII